MALIPTILQYGYTYIYVYTHSIPHYNTNGHLNNGPEHDEHVPLYSYFPISFPGPVCIWKIPLLD